MSIRPVDYQILMPKVNELAKTQNELHQKMVNQDLQQAKNMIKQADKDTESVHSQSEAQKTIITEEERKKGREQEQSKKRKSEKEEDNEQNNQPARENRTIDIRI